MSLSDSYDKVVMTYFAGVTALPFEYKGKVYAPKPLRVSPAFFHEYTCKLGCAGCCPRFSLDYLPEEERPDYPHQERTVRINGRDVVLYSKLQSPRPERRFCDNVNLETGACMVHGKQPFSCDFETLRFTHFADHSWLGTRPYGRGWNMMRVDGQRGAMCEFPKTATLEALAEAERKLMRLQRWAHAAGLLTYIPAVLRWCHDGPHPVGAEFFSTPSGLTLTRKVKQ